MTSFFIVCIFCYFLFILSETYGWDGPEVLSMMNFTREFTYYVYIYKITDNSPHLAWQAKIHKYSRGKSNKRETDKSNNTFQVPHCLHHPPAECLKIYIIILSCQHITK